ncbi:hypothetical protein E3Q23_00579 [Wallemia mellicola]|nr:hypothetical protein E3Q23_00579 [Wallemia mellicola]TIC14236.1 hypothetical protein E3Q14_00894 [Wallemia mellicola]TIC30544.1 hypothetical protein E3Q11_00949 [Wallemia mellicola]
MADKLENNNTAQPVADASSPAEDSSKNVSSSNKLDTTDTSKSVTNEPSTESPVQDLAVANRIQGLPPFTIEDKQNSTPMPKQQRNTRRLIICCDGTWQDAMQTRAEDEYTNILRLSRAIKQEDRRQDPPIPQICHYISGVGTGWSISDKIIGGATGNTLGVKLRDAYAFLSQNYCDGDEIFLFGFSRGAFTARTLGALINDIGILDNKEMEHFFDIFQAYNDRNNKLDKKKAEEAQKLLDPWLLINENNQRHKGRQFIIKCIGVFDTVGALGVPTLGSTLFKMHKGENYLGFPDTVLGDKVEHCYHALALHENRPNFIDTRFEVKKNNLERGQHCKQVWFTGCHSDIGGSYKEHELSDLTLIWMCACIESLLLLDIEYIKTIPDPMEGWDKIDAEPHLVAHLLPLEEQFKSAWKVAANAQKRKDSSKYQTSKDQKSFDELEVETLFRKYWNKAKNQLKNAQMAQYPTTILATEHSKEHWMACAKKLLAEGKENTLKELLEETTNSLRAHRQSDTPSKLLIDDLACLSWLGFPDSDIEWFVKSLLKMAEEIDADIVTIVHSPHHAALVESFSSIAIVTEPLSTGPSAEVTGQIKAYRGPLWDYTDSKPTGWIGWEKQFHLGDSSVDIFAKGLGKSVI